MMITNEADSCLSRTKSMPEQTSIRMATSSFISSVLWAGRKYGCARRTKTADVPKMARRPPNSHTRTLEAKSETATNPNRFPSCATSYQ